MRIASLLPSATEIVCTLGLADALVGISHDCDFPPEICSRPVLSDAIVTTGLPSSLIDARIRSQVHRGKSVYHLDETQLAALRPTLILTQELCSVCAPSYTLVTQAAKVLGTETTIASLEPADLDGILDTIQLVGDLTNTANRAGVVIRELRARIERVRSLTAGRPRPRVLCIEWLEPIYVGGHWIPEMVAIAGGDDVLARVKQPSRMVAWNEVVSAQPEVIVLMPCGFDVPRTRRDLHLFTDRPGWEALPAVRTGRVFLTDASAYFNRPGPRIVTGLEILATLLHPDVCRVDLPGGSFEKL